MVAVQVVDGLLTGVWPLAVDVQLASDQGLAGRAGGRAEGDGDLRLPGRLTEAGVAETVSVGVGMGVTSP